MYSRRASFAGLNSGDFEKRAIPNPARIPPQTPPAGGKPVEAGRIHIPSQMFRPAESALVFGVLRKMGSDFFKQTPQKLICIRIDLARASGAGEVNLSSNSELWSLYQKDSFTASRGTALLGLGYG